MKKKYFLSITLALFLSISGFSQTSTANFNFNVDNSGWKASNLTQILDPVDGSSKILLTKSATEIPTDPSGGYERSHKWNQTFHTTANFDTSEGNFLNIRLKNNSMNTRLVFFMLDQPGYPNVNFTLKASDTEFTTYTYDMSNVSQWTGILKKITIRFMLHPYNFNAVSDLEKSKNNESAVGEVLLDDISITKTSLSVNDVNFKDDTSISVYPNPANDVISIKSGRNINKINAYNILGQLQKVVTTNLNSIDVSSLNKGVYILKFYQNDGVVSTKRFVKN